MHMRGGQGMEKDGGKAEKGVKPSSRIRTIRAFVISAIITVLLGLLLDELRHTLIPTSSSWKDPNPHAILLVAVGYFVFVWGGLGLLHLITCPLRRRQFEISAKMRGLTGDGVPAADFLAHRGALRQDDFTGVYVLHNKTKGMYYVGQSVRVIDRVGQHLTGHGNGDVYADFKYGDEFEVSTVSLAESGYGSLNDLERDTIAAYDAYNSGYNRTPGNAR